MKADLGRRAPQSLRRGRHSTPVEVVLRMLVVRRLDDWSYEETEQFVAALTHPWSEGPTEGFVTKTKLIKRQMFGRAKLDLLRKRVLLVP